MKKKNKKEADYSDSTDWSGYELLEHNDSMGSACCYASVDVMRKIGENFVEIRCCCCMRECEVMGDR